MRPSLSLRANRLASIRKRLASTALFNSFFFFWKILFQDFIIITREKVAELLKCSRLKNKKKSHDRTDYAETKEKEPGKYGEPGGGSTTRHTYKTGAGADAIHKKPFPTAPEQWMRESEKQRSLLGKESPNKSICTH